jgi:hypothetical protein
MAGRTTHLASAPKLCPKGVVIELKREIVEAKGGRRWPASHQSLADRPCLASTQSLLSSLTQSCSYHAHSIDQKRQKYRKFLSSFFKVLFIYFLNFFDFILCNDEINMLWKRSK